MFGQAAATSAKCECPVSNYWLRTKVNKIDYRWEIPNFAKQLREGWTEITAPIIQASGTNLQWKLQMVQNSDGFVYVEVKEYSDRVVDSKNQVSLSLCIIDANNKKVFGEGFSEVSSSFVVVGKGHRFKLIRRNSVLENPLRYLPDGKLTVLCTLHYLELETDDADQLKELPVVPPSEIASCMGNVLAEGRFSDVVLVAEEREFPAHRVILAQRSDVFEVMFDVDMTEKRNNRVMIDDFSADVVSELLTFIYTDSAPNINKHAAELLVAAEKYNIPRLKAVCELELAKCLNIDNVIDRLLESQMYRADQLKAAAMHWIGKHAPDVVKTASWKSLCEEHPELVIPICEQFASCIKELTDKLKFGLPSQF